MGIKGPEIIFLRVADTCFFFQRKIVLMIPDLYALAHRGKQSYIKTNVCSKQREGALDQNFHTKRFTMLAFNAILERVNQLTP